MNWPYGALERFCGPMLVLNERLPRATWYPLTTARHSNIEVSTHNQVVADLLGLSVRTIVRWRAHGIPDQRADGIAVRLGVHPSAIWRDWFEAVAM